ncbi:MAG TPA: OmpA family protein [Aliidongia sp.]|uniref:OmpA family protein n=1 Tax=Aliidongia sp. TaxID=1914230 RepID=UPI002DDD0554|nr:OmpA family protein [Aliidongia sp.]HEV2674450.1 OmpA family protein [Aliidongia sp.]
MRGLILDTLADVRLGLLVLTLAALLTGCQDQNIRDQTGPGIAIDRIATTQQGQPDWLIPVLFDTDKSTIRADAKPIVTRIAALFGMYPQSRAIVEGYADERGTREYNLALGARRANAYRSALIAAGVPARQIADTVSYGKERPAVAGSTEAAWAQNRRAIVVLQQ